MALLIPLVLRTHPLVAGKELAVEHDLVERFAVDRQIERLAHPRVLAEGIVGCRPVGDIDGHSLVAELGNDGEFEIVVGPDGGDVGRQSALDQIEISRLKIGEAHGGVLDRPVDDLIDVHVVGIPVILEPLHDDAILLDALDETIRPGAHRLVAELVAELFGRLGRHDHAGAVGQGGDKRRERRAQVEADGEVVDHLDTFDGGQLGAPERRIHPAVAVERVFDGFGVHRLAVVELDVRPQADGQRSAVLGRFVRKCKLRHDVEIGVDIEQLVADRREHDAPDIGARQRRVEDIGILG